jgi:hypothetical protein
MAEPLDSQYNLPGRLARSVLGYEMDSQKEWDDKQRQEKLLQRLAALHPTPADRAKIDPRIASEIGSYERGELDSLKSPYHWRGVLAPGAPLYNAVAVFSAVPQMAAAGSQRLANWVDPKGNPYPNAKKQFDSALNTATMYGAEERGWVPKGTPTVVDVAEQARQMRGQRPANIAPAAWDEIVSGVAQQQAADLQLSASNSLHAAGVPKTAAMILGTGMDSVMDPWNGLGHAAKAARAGQRALGSLIGEFGTSQAMLSPAYGIPLLSNLIPELAPPPQQPSEYRTRPGDYIREF